MADYLYLDPTGVIVPDTADILTEVQTEYLSVLGADLSLAPETPQGVLMNAEALARAEVVANNAALANQINPNIAGGVFLDAICALTGFDPPAATHSLLTGVTVTGVASTAIPAGSQAETTEGDVFETLALVTLDGSGHGTVDFQSVETGPIAAIANHLTEIVTNVLGWETVTNPTAAELGTSSLSDQALRALRNNTLAGQGSSLAQAVTSALYKTTGVKSLQFRENVANSTQTIDGISLVAHSMWACVNGGTNLAVATSILSAKSGGCNYNGGVTQVVVDPASGQSYSVKFDRPTDIPMDVKATVRLPDSSVSAANVTQALLDYAAGLVAGQPGFVVGGSVSPFDLAGACTQQIPGIYVQKMEIKKHSTGSYVTTEIALALNEQASLITANITVVVL